MRVVEQPIYVPPPLDHRQQVIPSLMINASGDVVPPNGAGQAARQGTDFASKLKKQEVTEELVGEDTTCAICLIEYDMKKNMSMFDDDVEPSIVSQLHKCKHIFHYDCIKQWLENCQRNECPVCRGEAV